MPGELIVPDYDFLKKDESTWIGPVEFSCRMGYPSKDVLDLMSRRQWYTLIFGTEPFQEELE